MMLRRAQCRCPATAVATHPRLRATASSASPWNPLPSSLRGEDAPTTLGMRTSSTQIQYPQQQRRQRLCGTASSDDCRPPWRTGGAAVTTTTMTTRATSPLQNGGCGGVRTASTASEFSTLSPLSQLGRVSIGDVTVDVETAKAPHLVPRVTTDLDAAMAALTREELSHMRFVQPHLPPFLYPFSRFLFIWESTKQRRMSVWSDEARY